jgi:23S rRNA (uracil1939-C5)-methyltransferase
VTPGGCPHHGACGGCSLHTLGADAYLAAKRDTVTAALARHGLTGVDPAPPAAPAAIGTRRRLSLAFRRLGRRALLGLHHPRSDRIEDLSRCLVATPALSGLIEPLRMALAGLTRDGDRGDLWLLDGETGIDLTIARDTAPTTPERLAAVALADTLDLARIAWRHRHGDEPLIVRRAPRITLAGAVVEPPPAAFLQATVAGERAIQSAVLAAAGPLPSARRGRKRPLAIDLFAGVGTLTFALAAAGWRVLAIDRDGPALAALARAARGRPEIATETRDLVRRPLEPAAMADADLVVLDPPRAGAAAQARSIAAAGVARVVSISCEPESFARDARLMVAGGLAMATPILIDQFLWSPHVELVAAFRRGQAASPRPRVAPP